MAVDTVPRFTADRTRYALPLYAFIAAMFFAASSVPTPLYRLYQEAWGFSSATLTLVR